MLSLDLAHIPGSMMLWQIPTPMNHHNTSTTSNDNLLNKYIKNQSVQCQNQLASLHYVDSWNPLETSLLCVLWINFPMSMSKWLPPLALITSSQHLVCSLCRSYSLSLCQLTFSQYKPPLLIFSELLQVSFIVRQHVRFSHGKDKKRYISLSHSWLYWNYPPCIELLSFPAPSRTSPVARCSRLNHGQFTWTNIHCW